MAISGGSVALRCYLLLSGLLSESRASGAHPRREFNMASIEDIPPYRGHGKDRLIMENDRIAVWEEVFEPGVPTPPHRHTRDYIAIALDDGELTITPLVGDPEVYTSIAGDMEAEPRDAATRISYRTGCVAHSQVPAEGHGHRALNEGRTATRFILVEIKGTGTER